MNSMRCFISIGLEPAIKKDIEFYIKKLSADDLFKGIKWVKSDNIHITLAFLGEISLNNINQISEVMKLASNKLDPFVVNLKGTGFFPNMREPKVFWIGVEKTPSLYRLKEEIDVGLEKSGIKFDRKPFAPHLTLGRFKTGLNLKRHINFLPDFEASFLVEKISLVKSELLKEGPLYSDIFVCSLKKCLTH